MGERRSLRINLSQMVSDGLSCALPLIWQVLQQQVYPVQIPGIQQLRVNVWLILRGHICKRGIFSSSLSGWTHKAQHQARQHSQKQQTPMTGLYAELVSQKYHIKLHLVGVFSQTSSIPKGPSKEQATASSRRSGLQRLTSSSLACYARHVRAPDAHQSSRWQAPVAEREPGVKGGSSGRWRCSNPSLQMPPWPPTVLGTPAGEDYLFDLF